MEQEDEPRINYLNGVPDVIAESHQERHLPGQFAVLALEGGGGSKSQRAPLNTTCRGSASRKRGGGRGRARELAYPEEQGKESRVEGDGDDAGEHGEERIEERAIHALRSNSDINSARVSSDSSTMGEEGGGGGGTGSENGSYLDGEDQRGLGGDAAGDPWLNQRPDPPSQPRRRGQQDPSQYRAQRKALPPRHTKESALAIAGALHLQLTDGGGNPHNSGIKGRRGGRERGGRRRVGIFQNFP